MTSKIASLAVVVLLASSAVGAGQNVCPCIPTSHLWVATQCPEWTCAASELIAAHGDPFVVVLPMATQPVTWIVLRRIASDSYAESPGNPLAVESFESMPAAIARFSSLDGMTHPIMLTGADGTMVIVRLRQPDGRGHAAH